MKFQLSIPLFLLGTLVTLPANAMTFYLSQDMGVHGLVRVCKYSNGKLYSYNATTLCPQSVEEDGPPTTGHAVGYKSGEYQDGMTKVCVYDVMGNTRSVRIGGTELCPLNYEF